jgi:putative MATE family efflux protein
MVQGRRARLIDGPVGSTLLKLTVPMLFGMLGMVMFNLVDTFFVGQLGANELAALGFTFPVVMVVASMSMGLGIGTSSVISRAIGEGNQSRVQRLTTDSLALAVSVAAGVIILGLLTVDPVFRLLGATSEILPLIREYIIIWYVGVIFVIIPMVGNNAIRATGDTKTPSIIMLVAVVVNIVLDPLLIFGIGPFPRLELAGAAIATVIARASTFVVAVWVLAYREKMLNFARPPLDALLASWKQILHIGLPAAGTNLIMPLAIGIITSLVSAYGTPAVAAFGAASRVEMLAIAMVMALSAGLSPLVGQNWGAGQPERVRTAVAYSQSFALLWGALLFALLFLASRPIATMFNDDPAVVTAMSLYLSIAPLGYGLQGVLLLSNSVLNVLGKPLRASALMFLQMFVLYIPLAHAGSYLFGLTGIFSAVATANIIAGGIAFVWLRMTLRAGMAQQDQQQPEMLATSEASQV